uniref:Uncharacterized protein n=1 Tax=Porodaedalea pini TaxID=108901 RepID=A0A5B9RCB3_9AGAM|nr:hypothetical protein PPIT_000137 [Porodaedalea pini]QEG57033.1 hypothetical protein PPIT_000137 [Porodaedalea pini]
MQIKTINLKSKISRINLRNNLYKFFKQTKFNSKYLNVFTKVSTNKSTINLGPKQIINLKNQNEINTYKTLVINSFLNQEFKNKTNNKDLILIYYIETDKESYDNYIKQISNLNDSLLDSGE